MKLVLPPLSFGSLAIVALLAAAPAGLAQSSAVTPTGRAASGLTEKSFKHPCRDRLATLTRGERATFKAARRAALRDPAVKAARANKQAEPRAFHQALRAAMLKADPSVAPILEKLHRHHHRDRA
jgi:hypothetical protein